MGEFKQDMPPAGGYAPIKYQRIPLKAGLNPKLKLLIFFGVSGLGYAYFRHAKWQVTLNRLEDWSAHCALMPMILAETDRMLLRQLKRNRDDEEKLMENVKGWEVGKWQHMPVYSSTGPDEYFKPSVQEYFAHGEEWKKRHYKRVFLYN